MIAEATIAILLKTTFTGMGSAWALAVFEGDWLDAAVGVPALLLCGYCAVRHSRRLGGKRAAGGP